MTRSQLIVPLAFVLLVACGGSAAPGPKPLKYHYDEVYIAQFSMEEKAGVLEAQNEYQRARAGQMKAESDLGEIKTTLGVAQNERKQAVLSEESANQEKQAADSSGDMTRINQAARNMRVAELNRRAADDKVAYIKASRSYLKKLLRYRQEETFHREARYEHAKAKLGQAKNIAPKGVRYESYPGQTEERSRSAQKARQKFASDKQKADAAKKTWQARLKEAKAASGASGSSATDNNGSSPTSKGN
jgi:hypothetical protein